MFRGKKRKLLLVGCTGLLAERFIDKYADKYNIIGISRNVTSNNALTDHYIADITQDAKKIFNYVIEKHGLPDIVIFNAVFYDLGCITKKDTKLFLKEMAVGVIGPLELSNFLQSIWSTHSSKENYKNKRMVVFITSGSGLSVVKNAGQGTYSVVKAAQNMLVKHLDSEYEPYGVRVNAIAPGSLNDEKILSRTVEEINLTLDDRDGGVIKSISGASTHIF